MIRPLPGRIVIREHKLSGLIIMNEDPRSITTHRGTVIAAEPFVFPNGAVAPLDFKVGDVVQFHFAATEKGRTVDWGEHRDVVVMHQLEIDAVIE